MRRLVLTLALPAAAGLLLGCGSEEGNPPPAEPTTSPPVAEKPAGKVVRVGSEAEGVVVDPVTGLAAISFRDPNRIELVDVASGEVTAKVPTDDPARHLSLAGPGGPVLAPIEFQDQLLRIELPSGRIESTTTVGDFPHDATQAENGRVFVGAEGGDVISVVDGEAVEVELPAPEQPGGVAYADGRVAVVAVAERVLSVIDAETLEELARLSAGAGPSHVVAGDDGRFYVTDTGGDALLVYEGEPEPRLVDRTNISDSPYGIAIDNERGRIWVTQTARNRVVELEIADLAPRIIADYPTVRQPNSVGVDERTGRVVVVGRDRGDVQIFQPEDER